MVVCQLSPGLPRLVLTGSSSDTLSTDNEDGKFKFLILIWFLSVVNGGLASSDTLCTDTEDSRLIEPGRRDVSSISFSSSVEVFSLVSGREYLFVMVSGKLYKSFVECFDFFLSSLNEVPLILFGSAERPGRNTIK